MHHDMMREATWENGEDVRSGTGFPQIYSTCGMVKPLLFYKSYPMGLPYDIICHTSIASGCSLWDFENQEPHNNN